MSWYHLRKGTWSGQYAEALVSVSVIAATVSGDLRLVGDPGSVIGIEF